MNPSPAHASSGVDSVVISLLIASRPSFASIVIRNGWVSRSPDMVISYVGTG